jgi:predicted transcriptional regulator
MMLMPGKTLLLCLRPEFAEKVFEGKKRVELRRVRPKVTPDDWVLVYVSTPVKALIGAFRVRKVIEDNPDDLWDRVRKEAGITREEFDAYYEGAIKGFGIFLNDIRKLTNPVKLDHLREIWSDFRPPQCYRYMSSGEVELVEYFSNRIAAVNS